MRVQLVVRALMGSLASDGTGGAEVYEENESFSSAESTELAAETQR